MRVADNLLQHHLNTLGISYGEQFEDRLGNRPRRRHSRFVDGEVGPTYYVTVDEVQPKMAELGHDVSSKEGLGRAMAAIAADHEWQIRLVDMEDEGTIQILPIDDDTLSGNQSR
jgi:hypothetical protein